MKVLHVSYLSNDGSGAAVRRLNDALCQFGARSRFLYYQPYARETSSISWGLKKVNGLQNVIVSMFVGDHSLNLFPTPILRAINQSDADIVHLHWIHGEMLSVAQIARITKPIVWTFHSMWPMLGIGHWDEFVADSSPATISRGRLYGYLNKWTIRRKARYWENLEVQIVCPSTWLEGLVRSSMVPCSDKALVVPNCLNLEVFKPHDRLAARCRFGLPLDKQLILFGAHDPHNLRKGGDLLRQALRQMDSSNLVLVVFGASSGDEIEGIPTIWVGIIREEYQLASLYSAVDVMCVPSRIESFGQTASEPQACGVPVVAFNATGLRDVVEHKVTGYLAKPYDIEDYAFGIQWVLDADKKLLGENARKRAEMLWDAKKVARQMYSIYERTLEEYTERELYEVKTPS
jgi:glycosyltransferase involved in cell wall biosynthesis